MASTHELAALSISCGRVVTVVRILHWLYKHKVRLHKQMTRKLQATGYVPGTLATIKINEATKLTISWIAKGIMIQYSCLDTILNCKTD